MRLVSFIQNTSASIITNTLYLKEMQKHAIIQAIKFEYGQDLAWLIPYPGDWHLMKNYQLCLMKPFFEAGLRDLAVASSYPSQSIQNCSQFKRTHRFLMEVWEAMFRSMLQSFLANFRDKLNLEEMVASTLQEFEKSSYDKLALYSLIISSTRGELALMRNSTYLSRKCQRRMTPGNFGADLYLKIANPTSHSI